MAKVCNFSVGKAKLVLKKLQDEGFIKKIKTGSNLTGKANAYKVMNLQPIYREGKEVTLSEAEQNLSEEDFNTLLFKGKGVAYYYVDEEKYSYRKALPLLVNKESRQVTCFIDD